MAVKALTNKRWGGVKVFLTCISTGNFAVSFQAIFMPLKFLVSVKFEETVNISH